MDNEPLLWERVAWRQGDGRYVYEVAEGGLHATLTAPDGRKLTLPVVAWNGLVDALAAARKTKDRGERSEPLRAGQIWTPAETDRLVTAFESGMPIAKLAAAHNRSGWAIEAKLARLGLWDREARAPTSERSDASDTGLVPKDWPPRWPPEPRTGSEPPPRREPVPKLPPLPPPDMPLPERG